MIIFLEEKKVDSEPAPACLKTFFQSFLKQYAVVERNFDNIIPVEP